MDIKKGSSKTIPRYANIKSVWISASDVLEKGGTNTCEW